MMWDEIKNVLSKVYDSNDVNNIIKDLENIKPIIQLKRNPHSKNIALITYGSSLSSKDITPLHALSQFLDNYSLNNYLDIVHILPFYPWDTDRGFSVIDYYQVKKEYGEWEDVERIANNFRVMFDFVANHASVENPLVQGSLISKHLPASDSRYVDYGKYFNFVITYDENSAPTEEQLKTLIRPRPTYVLTNYCVIEKEDGSLKAVLGTKDNLEEKGKYLGGGLVWTTFSRPKKQDGTEDTRQVDLNFSNPKVFVEAINILHFYASKGAALIRLDAIGYLWKKLGSNSLHEPEVHYILEAMVKTLKILAPDVVCIAEINEPQDKVIKYLGTHEEPESDIVYQFTYFPLAIYSVLTGNTQYYKDWLKTTIDFEGKQFITILGSHDGLGLKPVMGILPKDEIEKLKSILIDRNKGLPNFALLPGGEKIVYEICGTPWNIINGNDSVYSQESLDKYIAIVVLGLTIKGIPAFYINGLLGTSNYSPATGLDENRTVNREEFDKNELFALIDTKTSKEHYIFNKIKHLLEIKNSHKAFDIDGEAPEVIDIGQNTIICIKLKKENSVVYVLVSCNKSTQQLNANFINNSPYKDLITGETIAESTIKLKPYQSMILVKLN